MAYAFLFNTMYDLGIQAWSIGEEFIIGLIAERVNILCIRAIIVIYFI